MGKLVEIQGHSMWPYLKHNDLLWVVPSKKVPAKGDLVWFEEEDDQVIHRMISDSRLKGDNLNYLDCEAIEVKGIVFGRVLHKKNKMNIVKIQSPSSNRLFSFLSERSLAIYGPRFLFYVALVLFGEVTRKLEIWRARPLSKRSNFFQ